MATFQSPSLRGSGRFAFRSLGTKSPLEFQSPSLRGSGRFISSGRPSIHRRYVSIPFIAGQWSLHLSVYILCVMGIIVSIPFIAGQWSLPIHHGRRIDGGDVSIPFIAGQWSLRRRRARRRMRRRRFNPLHCGAVVASGDPGNVGASAPPFQSPSLRGSGRFRTRRGRNRRWRRRFQSPSLRGSGRFLRRWPGSGIKKPSFNPLHCGAVVASVSVVIGTVIAARFQSPSLRGSGRFLDALARNRAQEEVSIPFIAGQWSLLGQRHRPRRPRRVSIPFIAGQWSLLRQKIQKVQGDDLFQSPSLRGSGRFIRFLEARDIAHACFNPLHCGAVVASVERPPRRTAGGVSIPFIAGQWSLPWSRGPG